MADEIEDAFLIVTSPAPRERVFATFLNQEVLVKTDKEGDAGWPIEGVTLYKNWQWRVPSRAALWGNYRLFNTSAEGGVLSFTWTKVKTDKEKDTPFRTWTEQGNHYWPGVLKTVKFFPDFKFPLSTSGPDGGIILAPRLYDRIVYQPPVSEGSLLQHDLFLSGTPFTIGQSPVPVPTAVSWSYHDSTGSFPECLHGKLSFPAQRSAFAAFTTGGGAVGASGFGPGQVFPATTPFEDWQPYVLSDQQDWTAVGWIRHRITVFPPSPPELIQR